MSGPRIVWFRDDLRLADNPALRAALDGDAPVLGLYVLDEASPGVRPLGGAARWWLHHSLASLAARLAERGGKLVLRRGPAGRILRELVDETGATAVFWNRRYGGAERDIDAETKAALREGGVEVASFAASLLFEPWTVTTGAGTPFRVYSPFWRACLALPAPRAPLPEPREVPGPAHAPASDRLGAPPHGSRLGRRPPCALGAGRACRPATAADLHRRRPGRLRSRPRRAGCRGHLTALPAAAVGRAQPACGVARGDRRRRRRPVPR